ncbi:sigma-70 family RNA polymerase sigma factor (plasmid) [Novosphingobium sp. BL-8A]|uniref:sigma-70 family RNA polymerase sigma factor n=1 Tax=Novosphingobium sp. BL-8A TaxID=3127639 RepID=UPI0037577649
MAISKLDYEEIIHQRRNLIRYARKITRDQADAEDVVQEAYLRLGEMASRQVLDRPGGYLTRIVRNLALDWIRRARQHIDTHEADGEAVLLGVAADAPSPEQAALARVEVDRLTAALAELPERMRIAVEMHRFGGAKLREIADELGISVTLAHQLVTEGVAHCRSRLR